MSNGLSSNGLSSESNSSLSDVPIKRGRGRPPGSKNKPREEVELDAPRCRTCGSSDLAIEGTSRAIRQEGFHEGKPYNVVRNRRYKCRACTRVFWGKIHEFI